MAEHGLAGYYGAMDTATAFINGHNRNAGSGDTVYRGMLEALPAPAPIRSVTEAAQAMFTDGVVQFPDLLSPSEVLEMRRWMDSLGDEDAQYEMKDWCFNKHLDADLCGTPQWLKLIDRSPVHEVLALALGHDHVCYGGSLWITGQGREMGMHTDFMLLRLPDGVLEQAKAIVPIVRATLHIYLDDQVAEIGPTLVIPGRHLAGHPPENQSTWNGRTPKMVSVKAGGAALFRHDLWHGAARNTSQRRRYLIQVHYAIAWHHGPQGVFGEPQSFEPQVLALATGRQRAVLGERESAPQTAAYAR